MNNYMIPSDDNFVEVVAKSIAKSRLRREANDEMFIMSGLRLEDSPEIEKSFDRMFELIWSKNTEEDRKNKEEYMEDARAAISAINLKFLTSGI